jgi:hypothetical protein
VCVCAECVCPSRGHVGAVADRPHRRSSSRAAGGQSVGGGDRREVERGEWEAGELGGRSARPREPGRGSGPRGGRLGDPTLGAVLGPAGVHM